MNTDKKELLEEVETGEKKEPKTGQKELKKGLNLDNLGKKSKKMSGKMLEILQNPRLFVENWFKINDISVREVDISMVGTVYLDYLELYKVFKSNSNDKIFLLSHKLIEMAFLEYISLSLEQELTNLAQTVLQNELDEAGEDSLKVWVRAVLGRDDALTLKVIQHWIWMVKRNIMDKPIIHHIMPILFGKQGSGKSLAIKKLCHPLNLLTTTSSMSDLGDSRCYQLMAQNYIMFFDELQGLERTDVGALKRQITADTNTYRILGKNSYKTVKMRCAFVGATNRSVSELVYDPTGMRRFYEIKTLDRLNWDLINSIDYLKIWHSVDANLESGYLTEEYLKQMHFVQNQMSHIEPIIEFLSECAVVPEADEYKEISSRELYNAYTFWANGAGYKNIASRQSITKKFISHGLPSFEVDQRKYFKINPKCDIVSTEVTTKKTVLPFKKGE